MARFGGIVIVVVFVIGFLISVICISMHALSTVALDHAVRHHWGRRERPQFLRDRVLLMVGVTSSMMAVHLAEMMVWATAYDFFDVAANDANDMYLAFVSYTALGYGDSVPQGTWRLFGPFTAMTGILLFGWSAALIYQVLRTTIPDSRGHAVWATRLHVDPAARALDDTDGVRPQPGL